MSMADQSWSANSFSTRRYPFQLAAITFFVFALLRPILLIGQSSRLASNQEKARALLAETIDALGGKQWVEIQSSRSEARTAKFFQGAPTGVTFQAILIHQAPDKTRLDVKKDRVVQIFSGNDFWEITYKGKRKLPQEEIDQYLRMEDHSLDEVLQHWYTNPATVLIDEGPTQMDRRMAESIKIINPTNQAVTLTIDAATHLPLRVSYIWRDPRFKDDSTDMIDFSNYHIVKGIETPFTIAHWENGEVVREVYLKKVEYNVTLPSDTFDPDKVAAHLK